MGAKYKNGVPVPISRWEGSWAWQLQQEREQRRQQAKQEKDKHESRQSRRR